MIKKEILNRVVELHEKGLIDTEIAKQIGKSPDTVAYYRKKLNIESNFRLNHPNIDEFILEDLNNKLSTYAICKKHQISSCYVRRVARDNDIQPFKQYLNQNRRFVKNNPFEDLSNPEVQYWLGMLAADGTISGTRLTLGLKEQDKTHIEKFIKFLGGKVKIRKTCKDEKYYSYTCSFRNKEVIDFLEKLGIIANKSLTLDYKGEITLDFLRGIIDGDGYIRKKSLDEISILTGSKLFANQLVTAIKKLFNIEAKLYIRMFKNEMYYVTILGKKRVPKILDELYLNACIFLDRKYNNAILDRNIEKK